MQMIGGVPIYPGGYSCVFKPQLKCKTKKIKKRNKNSIQSRRNHNQDKDKDKGISKLLFKKYADIEMQNIQKFHHALRKIPKSHKYFLFTKSTSCSPEKISPRDLKGFDDMCSNFTSHDVNESNINSPSTIRDLKLINMPDAGISINEWLFPIINNIDVHKKIIQPLNISRLKIFNDIISKLILNAIVPMNRQGVIHNDMKEDNILIKDTKRKSQQRKQQHSQHPHPTIIDWGISGISTHDEPIPQIIMNRYISISNPFSSILFTSEFSKNFSDFLKQNEMNDIHDFCNNLTFREKLRNFSLSQYLKHKEYGHYSHIQTFFTNVFNLFSNDISSLLPPLPSHLSQKMTKSPTDLYHMLSSNYILDILLHFTEFDERDQILRFQYVAYFTKVYIFNCDIWGTIFCYSVLFSFQDINKYHTYIDIDSSSYLSFLRNMLSIYMNQIMTHGHEKINVNKLIKSISSISNIM